MRAPATAAAVAVVAAAVSVTAAAHATPGRRVTARDAVVAVGPVTALTVGQDTHSAFPGATVEPDGTIRLTWREGTDHWESRDGRIRDATLTADGTPGAARTLRWGPGIDYRDPSIAHLTTAEGAADWLTWFTATSSNPAAGAWVQRDLGPTVRIDPGYPYAAITAPAVALPDGRVGAVFYARKPGEALDTAFMAWSTDGLAWTTNRIANGLTVGRAYTEPWAVIDGGTTHVLYRWGTTGIGIRSTPDSGRTWGAPRQILAGVTGRPTTIAASTGTLVMVARDAASGDPVLAVSTDHAATWQTWGPLTSTPGTGVGMTYAAVTEPDPAGAPGRLLVVFGVETDPAVSRLYRVTVTVT